MRITIVVAMAENRVIGADNRLIWHLPEDLKRFRALTTGHPVIMGRKTYESIGRPLPQRLNIVITRQENYEVASGVRVVRGFEEAIWEARRSGSDEAFVIGGGEIYRQALPKATRIQLTLVHQSPRGDTTFPEFDTKEFGETSRTEGVGCTFICYDRQP